MAPGQVPVKPKLEERNPHARRSAAERKENPKSPSQIYQPVAESEGEDGELSTKTAADKMWQSDRSMMGVLGRSFTDEAAQKGVALPEDHDWDSYDASCCDASRLREQVAARYQ